MSLGERRVARHLALERDLAAGLLAERYVVLDARLLFVGDEWADIGGGAYRIAERERRRPLDQAFDELVVYRLVYEQARA